MSRPYRFIASILLTSAFAAAPLVVVARPTPQEVKAQVRFYDKDHKDYHKWDDNENRAWGAYLSDNHKQNHDFAKASKKEQQEYWNWRHDHPDDKR